jgi:hypothetical protein
VTVGANLVDRRYHGYHLIGFDEHPSLIQFARIGFLPFAEVGVRLTRVTGMPRQALGDRMVSVRLRLLEEGARRPAVVVGAHDLVGLRNFHAVYAVGSKEVARLPVLGGVGLHLGYGLGDGLALSAEGRQFVGAFGGVSVAPRPGVELLAEHDAERVNAGVRLHVWRLSFLGAAYGLDGLSGGVSYTHQLK